MASEAGTVHQSDGELVARARAGDRGAFDQLFRRYYERTVNLAFRLNGDMDEAEDIAQTAFVRLHGGLARLRDGQALRAWLYRAVVNLVRDRHKSARRKPWVRLTDMLRGDDGSDGDQDEWAASWSGDPGRLAEGKQLAEALETAIASLPLEFREPVVLHHLDQMDVEEIAGVLGVPVGTVKSRLARGRERLRRMLLPWFADDTKEV